MSTLLKLSKFFSQFRVATNVKGTKLILSASIRRVRRILKFVGVSFSGHYASGTLISLTVFAGRKVLAMTEVRGQTVVTFQ